eukprot:TRINITY_DN6074_c0_g1_i2.p2 TRINITY_DN6074_c0_g1~~TRINITY_DN6074_c0_g1_i2.p2  ORF type:complete len:210 (+),score=40.06 TRINITY_DN6074_c0_g1_i2:241-870(+)
MGGRIAIVESELKVHKEQLTDIANQQRVDSKTLSEIKDLLVNSYGRPPAGNATVAGSADGAREGPAHAVAAPPPALPEGGIRPRDLLAHAAAEARGAGNGQAAHAGEHAPPEEEDAYIPITREFHRRWCIMCGVGETRECATFVEFNTEPYRTVRYNVWRAKVMGGKTLSQWRTKARSLDIPGDAVQAVRTLSEMSDLIMEHKAEAMQD